MNKGGLRCAEQSRGSSQCSLVIRSKVLLLGATAVTSCSRLAALTYCVARPNYDHGKPPQSGALGMDNSGPASGSNRCRKPLWRLWLVPFYSTYCARASAYGATS